MYVIMSSVVSGIDYNDKQWYVVDFVIKHVQTNEVKDFAFNN